MSISKPQYAAAGLPGRPNTGVPLTRRFARAHVHAGHKQFTGLLDAGLDEVEVAIGRAAARDHEVVLAHRFEHRDLQGLERILHDGQHGGKRARGAGGRGQRIAVGIADLARGGNLGGRHELAADGDDGHTRTARGGNLGHAAAGQKAHAGGVDDLAGANDGLAGARLLARFAHVTAQLGRRLEGDAAAGAAVAFHVAHDLVLHHGVGGRGQRRAGHDAHACALGDVALEGVSGGNLRDNVQRRVIRGLRTAAGRRAWQTRPWRHGRTARCRYRFSGRRRQRGRPRPTRGPFPQATGKRAITPGHALARPRSSPAWHVLSITNDIEPLHYTACRIKRHEYRQGHRKGRTTRKPRTRGRSVFTAGDEGGGAFSSRGRGESRSPPSPARRHLSRVVNKRLRTGDGDVFAAGDEGGCVHVRTGRARDRRNAATRTNPRGRYSS